jgi:hypothetical protein
MDAKQGRLTGPNPLGLEPRRSCHLLELINAVFVRVFGVESFPSLELKDLVAHPHRLVFPADQMHFHSPFSRIVKSAMFKVAKVKITF